ncbi:TFIID-31kDa-domain-containing protein [Polychaeton citri CBS 116435]|uniref:TFIID-31kDa-domain-containing protein n=1 Tax=Polychaeton citri CBS 116435 TaxID=1314669 RepID=A0A9P4Q5E0_9PEZI|nr:TFIID-31kDa-domain-containing protein [Polychaeton citri CBS 116435]
MASPSTPPVSDPANQPQQPSQPSSQQQPQPSQPATLPTDPEVPLTSTQDDATSTRPKDARILEIVLSSFGVQAYQERVPLQLMDFAYRYTSSVLSDALRLSAEGYSASTQNEREKRRAAANAVEEGDRITVTALRQAIASRQGYVFQGALPKEFLLGEAAERNKVALPRVSERRGYGVLLPEEKYCLTGTGWGVRDEWSSDEEEDEEEEEAGVGAVNGVGDEEGGEKEDADMGGIDDAGDEDDEEGGGKMEDVFGEENGGDAEMGDA